MQDPGQTIQGAKPTVAGIQRQDGSGEVAFTNTMPLSRKMLLNKVVVKRRAYLEIMGKGAFSKIVELREGEFRMGRSPMCEIQLTLNNISRVHAHVIMRNEEYVVEDLASTNGTYVNGILIVRCILRDGDLIEIGEAKLHFYEEKVRQPA
jgi:pSer/pThr/pTyr-binding forkhead associated (FHA) protein